MFARGGWMHVCVCLCRPRVGGVMFVVPEQGQQVCVIKKRDPACMG